MKIIEQTEFELEVPLKSLPNIIHAHSIGGDSNIIKSYVVADLTPEQALAYSEALKDAFMNHWRTKRNEPVIESTTQPASGKGGTDE